jgi:hypothetical protein
MCNSANRDVAVDDIGACGSKVLIVNKMNTDTHVTYGADVISVIGAKAPPRTTASPATNSRTQTRADAPIGSPVKFMVDGNPMARCPGSLRPLCAAEEDASTVDNVPVVD